MSARASLTAALLFAALMTPAAGLGAETLFEMSFSADKEVLTLGDELALTIEVTHAKGFRLLELPKGIRFDPFELKRIERIPPREDGNTVREGYRIVLTLFELGEHTIAPFNVLFLDDKGKRGQVPTEEVRVTVRSVGRTEKDQDDIRPLKSPYRLSPPLDPRKVGLWVAAVLAAALLALLALLFWNRRKKEDPEGRLGGAERALLHLDRLAQKGYLEKGQAKAFFTEFSEILERYIVGTLKIGAPELTTEEFLAVAERTALAAEAKAALKELFWISDLAKFAKWVPPAGESARAVETARRFITWTRPAACPKSAVALPVETEKVEG